MTQKHKWKEAFSTIIKKTHQLQSIKSNKEVTRNTRETHFLYRKSQKLKFVKNGIENCLRKIFLHAVSSIVPKIQKVGNYCRNNKLGVTFKKGLRWMKASFFDFFHSALAILEPQFYLDVEQFWAENISLLVTFIKWALSLVTRKKLPRKKRLGQKHLGQKRPNQ